MADTKLNLPARLLRKRWPDDLVAKYISEGWEKKYGGKLEFIPDPVDMVQATLAHIDKKRAALGLPAWNPSQFGRSGDKAMLEFEAMPVAYKREAIYG